MATVLEGGKELERKLNRLDKTAAKKIARKAVRAGAKPINAATKENARSVVGGNMGRLLSKNIVTRAYKKQRRGSYAVSVGTRPDVAEFIHEAKSTGQRSYIPAAIEFGHGNAAPISFMRKAVDSKGDMALRAVVNKMDQGIRQEAIKK